MKKKRGDKLACLEYLICCQFQYLNRTFYLYPSQYIFLHKKKYFMISLGTLSSSIM